MIEKEISYRPVNVCSQYMKITIVEDENAGKGSGVIKDVVFMGGCPGNAVGLGIALRGRNIVNVIDMLKDIKCGIKDTSCPAQLAKALETYINS